MFFLIVWVKQYHLITAGTPRAITYTQPIPHRNTTLRRGNGAVLPVGSDEKADYQRRAVHDLQLTGGDKDADQIRAFRAA